MDYNDQADAEDRDYCTDRFLDEMEELREQNAALRAEVERLRAELREHWGLAKSSNAEHADVEAAWRAEVERLREAVLAAYRKGHHHTVNGGYQWCDQGGREVVEEIIREAGGE